jgi:hypothetical protein
MLLCNRKMILGLSGLLFIVAGCTQDNTTSDWPAPTFEGPANSPPVATAPPILPPYAHAAPPGIPQAWVPLARARDWQFIVIHHSATFYGGAARFDREHRQRGFDELGYDFVIGNGTDTRDGQVEVGPRWPIQKWGAHAGTPDERYNNFGIGICLVGNFDIQYPSARQMQSLAKLVAFLQETYHIPASHILGHRDTKATECPGKHLTDAMVRRAAARVLAEEGFAEPPDRRFAGELMRPIGQ